VSRMRGRLRPRIRAGWHESFEAARVGRVTANDAVLTHDKHVAIGRAAIRSKLFKEMT
jgi:hypothetical protein